MILVCDFHIFLDIKHNEIIRNSLIEIPRSFAVMTMKKLLGISLALVMLIGSVPLGFSESLRVQLDQGMEIDQIQCDDPNHVLVLRTNGNVACVTEKISERLGWEIISVPYVESGKIPNPTGYWVPIPEEDREDFAKKFANAAGDSLTGEVSKFGVYRTEYGHVRVNAQALNLYDFSIEVGDRKKFTENFMDSMGFEFDDEDVKIVDGRSHHIFYYSHEYSSVTFTFHNFLDDTNIRFGGWTNNPELVTFPLSEEIAIEKAFEYIENNEEIYIPESEGGGCEAVINESANVLKYVDGGIPYYKIQLGFCTHSTTYIIMGDFGVNVIMDAITGEDIQIKVPSYS